MERNTGIPKSLIDAIIALFILFATMRGLFNFLKKRRKKKLDSHDKGERESKLIGKNASSKAEEVAGNV